MEGVPPRARLGGTPSIQCAPWPLFDSTRLTVTEVKLVFQINGKHRGDQWVPVGLAQEAAMEVARSHPKIVAHLDGKKIIRIVYVPGKILNLVVT